MTVKINEKGTLNSWSFFTYFLKPLLFFASKSDAHVEFPCTGHFKIWLCMAGYFIGGNCFFGVAGEQGEAEL
jgi:hypothetical protein